MAYGHHETCMHPAHPCQCPAGYWEARLGAEPMTEFVKCTDPSCRHKGRHAHPRRFTFDGPVGKAAIRKAAYACCEVNDCGGTKAQPCTKHTAAAEKMFRDIAEIWN